MYSMRERHVLDCFGILAYLFFPEVSQASQAQALLMPFYQAQSEPDIWRRKQRMNAQLSKTVFQSRLSSHGYINLAGSGYLRLVGLVLQKTNSESKAGKAKGIRAKRSVAANIFVRTRLECLAWALA